MQVLQVQPGGIEEENEMTLRTMDQYGWWNVRGGNWCQVEIQSCPPALLKWQRLKLPAPLRQNQSIIYQENPTEIRKMAVLDVVETLILLKTVLQEPILMVRPWIHLTQNQILLNQTQVLATVVDVTLTLPKIVTQ